MVSVPAGIAAESAMLRQNVGLSVLKQSANADKQIANMLESTILSSPVRGTSVNIKA